MLAGKGHEDYQEIRGVKHPMDERDLIRDILAEGHIPGSAANNEENRLNTLYADIIVDISHEKLDRTFQYRVPESLRGRLEPGACVMIPFGNGNRLIKGYVVALGETCQFAPEKIKDIAGMPEKRPEWRTK